MVSPLPGQRTAAYPTVSPLPLFHDIPLLASPSDFDESVVNLVHFSAAMIVEACVRCLRVILPDFESPSSMPEVMSARYRMCSTLANACQGLGYQGEIGYQTFLYSSVKEWRKLLMFLLEKLPREAVQAADEPTGEGEGGEGEGGEGEGVMERLIHVFVFHAGASVLLNRRMATELSSALTSVWTPSLCKRQGMAWSRAHWRREVSRVCASLTLYLVV